MRYVFHFKRFKQTGVIMTTKKFYHRGLGAALLHFRGLVDIPIASVMIQRSQCREIEPRGEVSQVPI